MKLSMLPTRMDLLSGVNQDQCRTHSLQVGKSEDHNLVIHSVKAGEEQKTWISLWLGVNAQWLPCAVKNDMFQDFG